MKCSAVQLLNRSEYNRWKLNRNIQRSSEPVYITKGYQGYAFTFLHNNTHVSRKQPILSVSELHLPADACPLNAGYSLTKWSNKIPRLRSGTKNRAKSKDHDLESECDTSYDVNNILDGTDINEVLENSDNNNVEDFEIHSDIEELIRQSEEMRLRREEQEEKEKGVKHGDKSRKRKHRLKKTIRFSFSKPASPQTEQVIRVDVTSNISVEELLQMECNRSDTRTDSVNKLMMLKERTRYEECELETTTKNSTHNHGGKIMDRSFNELSFNGEEEEFIIRCRQLALTHKKR